MKLFILASALMLVLVFSSYVSADDPSDLDTAESQASFGYGYGTKVSNFMSSSEFNLACLFVSRVGSNLCLMNRIHICSVPQGTRETRGH